MKLTHRERLENTLSGINTDQIPCALWRRFPVDDQDPLTLAKATIAFQEQFDFDFVKVSPPSSYCLKDWGVQDVWRGNPEGTRKYTVRPIQHPDDWLKLQVLNPYEGWLSQQLLCLSELKKAFGDHTPFVQTIFNPLYQAKNLAGSERLLIHLREFPNALHHGLKTISQTTIRFIEALYQTGISGIFFAIQHASSLVVSEQEYMQFGKAYDLPILQAAKTFWLNIAHLHGENIFFDLLADYPVHIMNWHDQETPPSLIECLERFSGVACGGIKRLQSLVLGRPENIKQDVLGAIHQTGGKRLVLGTGCVLPLTTPYGNIMAIRNTIEEIAKCV